MENFSACIDYSELNDEDRSFLRETYFALYMKAVKREKQDQNLIFRDYVKPILDRSGALEDSLLHKLYETFIMGVNAGIEFNEFIHGFPDDDQE